MKLLILLNLMLSTQTFATEDNCMLALSREKSAWQQKVAEFFKRYIDDQDPADFKTVVIELNRPIWTKSGQFKAKPVWGNHEAIHLVDRTFDENHLEQNLSLRAIRSFCYVRKLQCDLLLYIPGGFLSGWKLRYDFETKQWANLNGQTHIFEENTPILEYLYHRTSTSYDIVITSKK